MSSSSKHFGQRIKRSKEEEEEEEEKNKKERKKKLTTRISQLRMKAAVE
jgi:hypothetical protein